MKNDITTTLGFFNTYFDLLKFFNTTTETFEYLNNEVEFITGKKPFKDFNEFKSKTMLK
ncbi:hypothetical protein DFQ11_101935 [Winogradskyella epiphytica]|uniref:Uncharacterized protein n=1 Tax=Winogradskyella epiphytica TaxID=262005 RepID=A0A2V4XN58_9FLAO|nr:hypothetical protein [Winogradskyella epiphytica]PYE83499.1 hypothetical protein DFQ11_101935 [Winogradskyella epiphytica]GGW58618.1 hypothetical protein GCM10008085_07920 [Winogradskyella epiphytica]